MSHAGGTATHMVVAIRWSAPVAEDGAGRTRHHGPFDGAEATAVAAAAAVAAIAATIAAAAAAETEGVIAAAALSAARLATAVVLEARAAASRAVALEARPGASKSHYTHMPADRAIEVELTLPRPKPTTPSTPSTSSRLVPTFVTLTSSTPFHIPNLVQIVTDIVASIWTITARVSPGPFQQTRLRLHAEALASKTCHMKELSGLGGGNDGSNVIFGAHHCRTGVHDSTYVDVAPVTTSRRAGVLVCPRRLLVHTCMTCRTRVDARSTLYFVVAQWEQTETDARTERLSTPLTSARSQLR